MRIGRLSSLISKERSTTPPVPPNGHSYESVKRLGDILAGTLLLVLSSPLLLFVAIWIRLTSPGSVLYRQARVGRGNRLFYVFKFRTMFENADRVGPLITSSDDSRVTPVGRMLRATKLDELPQLLNVVKGDMSLVGPRPQVPDFVQHFSAEHRLIILGVRPGITGPTQIRFRCEEQMLEGIPDRERYYIETLLPLKCLLDVDYVQRRSLGYDACVLVQTARIFSGAMARRVFGRRCGIRSRIAAAHTCAADQRDPLATHVGGEMMPLSPEDSDLPAVAAHTSGSRQSL
jgi:lipopolysaccharide/colanic/teichoic acid biosynthesis glycosyltransferase